MLDVYRLLANRVGTGDADELAHELRQWHDDMVRHERSLTATGRTCVDAEECPHFDAADLWRRARQVFGREADTLVFLRESAAAPVPTR